MRTTTQTLLCISLAAACGDSTTADDSAGETKAADPGDDDAGSDADPEADGRISNSRERTMIDDDGECVRTSGCPSSARDCSSPKASARARPIGSATSPSTDSSRRTVVAWIITLVGALSVRR